ncbi:GGDEF domain-containing protein [Leucothrix mucor]|uniref:GGDEF domain-containing protein n=1 Tax=Leucothrix mucor TaxID=45248 RepID=UPI0003B4C2E7|nr:GGDEF domain-containing protein [Leucothrix mucor]
MNNRSYKENIILLVCCVGSSLILPFMVFRFFGGHYFVSLMDFLLLVVMLGIFGYVYKTGKVIGAGLLLSMLSLSVTVMLIHLKGPPAVYWYYPTALTCYCITSFKIANIFNIIGVTLLIPALYTAMPMDEMMTVFATIIMLCVFGYAFSFNTESHQSKLSQLAARDALTGAWNRRSLDESLIAKVGSKRQRDRQSSLLILDLDHFKHINDTYGHGVGDEILKKIADLIRSNIRVTDKFYRYGGEEFVIVADSTDLEAASVLAETIRARVEHSKIFSEKQITISLGIAALDNADSPESWLNRADEALYSAKNQGRNKVCMAVAA